MQMGSKKRAAWSKAKSEFLSTATGGDMSDLFAREDERRDTIADAILEQPNDEMWLLVDSTNIKDCLLYTSDAADEL